MKKALRDFVRKRKAEGVETLLETIGDCSTAGGTAGGGDTAGGHYLNSVQCIGIWEDLQVYVQEIRKDLETVKKDMDDADDMDDSDDMAEEGPGTIVDVAVATDGFSTLVAAVQAAGLVDTLNGEGQTRDGLPLVIITDFGLRHHVHHAERQQDRQRNHGVGLTFLEGGPAEQDQPDDGADAVEDRITCNEGQRSELRGQRRS